MKRTLAILLSVCLCITLLPVGAGAQVRDESQVKNLLSMLNIMVGDSDGNFYPDNPSNFDDRLDCFVNGNGEQQPA